MKTICILFLWGFVMMTCDAMEPINMLLLFSLTRMEGTLNIVDDINSAAFLASAALINQFNAGNRPVNGVNYRCPVEITYEIRNTFSNFQSTLDHFTELDLNDFDIILGPSRSQVCIPVSFAASPFDLPVFSPSCTSPALDDAVSHRFFARTIASDDSTAQALVALLKDLPTAERTPTEESISLNLNTRVYTKVVVLYQDDSYGTQYKDSLFEADFEANLGSEIEFLFFPFKPADEESIKSALTRAGETGINIFVGVLNLESLASLVTVAVEQDLMGEGKLWIFSDGVLGAGEIMEATEGLSNSERKEVLNALDNSFLVQSTGRDFDPRFSLFDEQFFEESAGYTQEIIDEMIVAAGEDVDYEETLQAFGEENFQASDFALFAYDALIAIREYIESDENCTPSFSGQDFLTHITSTDFTFEGATGIVAFDSITAARTQGTSLYKAVNLRFTEQRDVFSAEDVLVGIFSNSVWTLIDVEFNGRDTAPLVVDLPESIERAGISSQIQAVSFTLATVVLLITLGMGIFVLRTSHKNVIKAAQPLFLYIMLLGVIFSTIAIYILPRNDTKTVEDSESGPSIRCNAPFFLISFGTTISYAALIFKLQRVIKVANITPDLRDTRRDSVWDSMRGMLLVVCINLGLMILSYSINPLIVSEQVIEVDEFDQPLVTFDTCIPDENGNGAIYALLFAFHLLFYVYGFKLIAKTRNLSSDFQEGKYITISVVSQFQLYLLGIPVVIAVGSDDPGLRYLVVSLIVLFSNSILMVLIFAPKLYRVMSGDDDIVWSDRNLAPGLDHYSTKHDLKESRKYQSVRKSLFNTMATQDFGADVTL